MLAIVFAVTCGFIAGFGAGRYLEARSFRFLMDEATRRPIYIVGEDGELRVLTARKEFHTTTTDP